MPTQLILLHSITHIISYDDPYALAHNAETFPSHTIVL
jgi:hypothetical protein